MQRFELPVTEEKNSPEKTFVGFRETKKRQAKNKGEQSRRQVLLEEEALIAEVAPLVLTEKKFPWGVPPNKKYREDKFQAVAPAVLKVEPLFSFLNRSIPPTRGQAPLPLCFELPSTKPKTRL